MVRISLVPTLVLMVFYVSTFRRMCAVPNMAVFCSSLIIIIIIIIVFVKEHLSETLGRKWTHGLIHKYYMG